MKFLTLKIISHTQRSPSKIQLINFRTTNHLSGIIVWQKQLQCLHNVWQLWP